MGGAQVGDCTAGDLILPLIPHTWAVPYRRYRLQRAEALLSECPMTDRPFARIKLMNPTHVAITRLDQITRAIIIAKSIGVRYAAGYLRDRGFSIEAALYLLARRK